MSTSFKTLAARASKIGLSLDRRGPGAIVTHPTTGFACKYCLTPEGWAPSNNRSYGFNSLKQVAINIAARDY